VGNEGVDVLTFTSGTAASAIAYAINRITDSTGVQVDLINSAAPTPVSCSNPLVMGPELCFRPSPVRNLRHRNSANTANSSRRIDAVATINGALTVADGLNLED